MKSLKSNKGFTLVELVVVIAILGILAGIAIPRFLDATASARGAKIVADMRTIESGETIYYAKYAKYPTGTDDANFTALVQGGWPTPPTGSFTIAKTLVSTGGVTSGSAATAYAYTAGANDNPGTLKLTCTGADANGKTLTELLGGKS